MEFDYFNENYKVFETTFNEIYAGDEPLTFITDDLLMAMTVGRPYFVLPCQRATDRRNHRFYFKIEELNHKDVYKFSHVD